MADSPRRPGPPLVTAVRRTERLSPSMVRLVIGGGDLDRFGAVDATDAYVKMVFLHPGVEYPRPLDVEAIRATMPSEAWPRVRSYTVRAWDAEARELTLDFVVHGEEGIAGPWAASAQVGDEVLLRGPGGGYAPDPHAGWHLLVGDESALPAIAAALERLPPDALAHVLLEVHSPEDELPLTMPATGTLTWVHRGDDLPGGALVEAVGALEFPASDVHAFVHGEAGFVKTLRRLLLVERGVPRDRLSISGYWRLGSDDEGWRATKAAWTREVEEIERLAGVS